MPRNPRSGPRSGDPFVFYPLSQTARDSVRPLAPSPPYSSPFFPPPRIYGVLKGSCIAPLLL